jgi:hypothetical protein
LHDEESLRTSDFSWCGRHPPSGCHQTCKVLIGYR